MTNHFTKDEYFTELDEETSSPLVDDENRVILDTKLN